MTGSPPSTDTGKPTILIAAYEPSLGRLRVSNLEEAGYVCQTAANTATAKQLFSRHRFDLALFDLDMPGESGLDLLRHQTATFLSLAPLLSCNLHQ